jgi:putative DNA primase/helicase
MDNFQVKDVPEDFRDAVKARFGQGVRMSTPREEGVYKGDVLAQGDFVAQRVGLDSVVFHKRNDLEFKSEALKGKSAAHSLSGEFAEVSYRKSKDNGGKAEVWSFNPEKDRFDRVVHALMKEATTSDRQGLERLAERAWTAHSQRQSVGARSQQPPSPAKAQEPAKKPAREKSR